MCLAVRHVWLRIYSLKKLSAMVGLLVLQNEIMMCKGGVMKITIRNTSNKKYVLGVIVAFLWANFLIYLCGYDYFNRLPIFFVICFSVSNGFVGLWVADFFLKRTIYINE